MPEWFFAVVEVLCVLLIAVGFGLWIDLGCGLAVGGALGLGLVAVAQIPAKPAPREEG